VQPALHAICLEIYPASRRVGEHRSVEVCSTVAQIKRAGATSFIASLNSPSSKTITSIGTRYVSEGVHKRVGAVKHHSSCQGRLSPEACWLERTPVPGVGMGAAYDLLAVARNEVGPVGVGAVVSGAAGDHVRERGVVERVHDSSLAPPEILSLESSKGGPSSTTSRPSPPDTASLPRVPETSSLPDPPVTMSSPLRPKIWSSPGPPESASSPPAPNSEGSPRAGRRRRALLWSRHPPCPRWRRDPLCQ
jgi:hypothetical protein